jgi:Asp-tRNA(Asn)/Glu-tRNA(Gln) amidotransferase A subunit family amidase
MAATYELSASEAARRIRAGSLSPSNLVAACLKRVDATEPAVGAWVRLDRDAAARVAVQRDIEAREGRFMGPLHGVPIALKDVFDAAGVPTTSGAPAWAARTATVDATVVARLRGAGAVPMGKLVTTPFAFLDPSATRNPWNSEHTPGGSSSGPAAAVAARMVPLALGSQTVGSVLRPAAYCGVIGFKPTHRRISTAGVLALAESLDHVGVFARSVEDCALALSLLAGPDPADPHTSAVPPGPYLAALAAPGPPRVGVLGTLIAQATPEMAKHLDAILRELEGAGARLVDVDLPDSFATLRAAGETVLAVEAAYAHAPLYAAHAADYPPRLKELIERGHAVTAPAYLAAQRARRRAGDELDAVASRHDALLAPTIGAPAPRGLGSTGDPGFCAPFTFAGLPAISLPTGLDPSGLPLALQLVGAAWSEARLLAAAAWCESVIRFDAGPSL